MRSSIGGAPIEDGTCLCDHLFNSPADWAATFHLRGFRLVCAVFLCDPTTDGEACSFMTDGYGIFNVRMHLGACRTHEGGSWHKQVCTRVDSGGGQTNGLSPCPARDLNQASLDYKSDALQLSYPTPPPPGQKCIEMICTGNSLTNGVCVVLRVQLQRITMGEQVYVADNLAFFPFQVQDEPLFVIHQIDIIVSVAGSNLMQSFKEVSQPSGCVSSV